MAKPFYSIEEACELLKKSADEVKALVRDGALREFRDQGKIFFRAEDVNKLVAPTESKGGSGELILEPVEESLPSIGPTSGGTSVIGLEPMEDEPAPPPQPAPPRREEKPAVSSAGIGVFDDDELDIDADPMAKTQITTGPVADRVALEGSGSGSGLLDLTREADDTSLGAELLDEIYPGEEEATAPVRPKAPAVVEAPPEPEPEPAYEAVEAAPAAILTPSAPAGDPVEGMMGGLLVGALLLLALAGSVVGATLQGFVPDYALFLGGNFLYLIIGALLVPLLSLLVGWLIGRTSTPKAPKRA
jgi:hypothetical protein